MNPTNEQELREQVLTEFKQVHKLAPADYTENCTNVVMSIVQSHTNAEIAKALKGVEVTIKAFDREIVPTVNGGNEMVDYRSVLNIIERTRKAAERAKLKEEK